jgi:hypothetical protein
MTFWINTEAAGGLPAQLDRVRDDALAGSAYVDAHTTLSYGGVLDAITGAHEHAVGQVRSYLDMLAGPVAGNTAEAVRVALTYYRQTDANAAASLDATYPAHEGRGDIYLGGGRPSLGNGFTDVSEPSDRYRPPPDRSEEFSFHVPIAALISPAAMGRTLIVEATMLASKLGLGHPWDPYEAILKPVTGDWNGLRRCADVFESVAEALEEMGGNVQSAASSITNVWIGNAADGVFAYLTEIAESLEKARGPVKRLAKSYEDAAEGAHKLFETLSDVLNDLIDSVIIFIAEASAAGATSETVVGGIAFGAAAGYEAYKMYKEIKHLVELMATLKALVEAYESAERGFGLVDGDVALPVLADARPGLPGNQASVGIPSIAPAQADIPHMAAASHRGLLQLPL